MRRKCQFSFFVEKLVLKEVMSRRTTNHENDIMHPPYDISEITEINNYIKEFSSNLF